MLDFHDQLQLLLARGLTAPAARALALGDETGSLDLATATGRQHLLLRLHGEGLHRSGEVHWPAKADVLGLATRLRHAGVRLAWLGGEGYPDRLARRLDKNAPAWVWTAGPARRLEALSCAMIGSRESPPTYLAAARRLAQALAEAGVTIVSGLAPGADSAAHEGSLRGAGGALAIPARGILQIDLTASRAAAAADGGEARLTCLGLDRPDSPFSAGLAIRRNDAIAALGEGLVLVASGLRGGSSYAVRWALEHKLPLWTFEQGAATPPANRHLIRQGLAQSLGLKESAEAWVERILPVLKKRQAAEVADKKQPRTDACQLDLLLG